MKGRPILLPVALLALTSGSAWAAPGDRIIACDPPLDRPLTLVMTQNFYLADGTAASATVTRSLRFTRNVEGLAVEAHIAALDTSDSQPDALNRLRLAYGAPGDVPIRIHLDPALAIERIDSLDRLWQDFRHRQTLLAGAMGKHNQSVRRAQGIAKMLDALRDTDQVAILSAFLKPVLRHCGTLVPTGAAYQSDGAIETEIRADTGNAREVSRYHIDPHSGLMQSLDRTIISADAPLRPLKEHWTLQKVVQ